MPKTLLHIAVALVTRDDLWLVAKRPPNTHLPGHWEFPGGKCHPAEAPENAAIRELHEECGVEATFKRSLPPVFHEYSDRRVHITPILCEWKDGEAHPIASDECRWVSRAQLRDLKMPEINSHIIDQLEQVLSSQ